MKKILPLLGMLSVPLSVMAEDTFSLSTGFDYSTGKYGSSTSTDILYIPVTAKYETDDLTFKLTLPYISETGTTGVVRGMGRIKPVAGKPVATATKKTTSASGLGDVVGSAGYTIIDEDALSIDVVGKIKFGTADFSQGLGTGKNDYSLQTDGYYTVQKTTFFATAGYRLVGKPAGLALNNTAYGTLGASQKLNDKFSAGILLDVAQSASAGNVGPIEATAYVSNKLSKTLKVQVNVLKGLSNGSPNFGFGAMITSVF